MKNAALWDGQKLADALFTIRVLEFKTLHIGQFEMF